jgi:hypothetical protein
MDSLEQRLMKQLKFSQGKQLAHHLDSEHVAAEKWDGYSQGLKFALFQMELIEKEKTDAGKTLCQSTK